MAPATCFATAAERRRSLPADGMVSDPLFTSTHAITIDAPPERVWPWLVQMGSGRAGWYSWDAIDNGGTPSSSSLLSMFQTVAPGDIMPAVPGAKDAFVVAAITPHADLVLSVPDGQGGHAVSWEHFLQPLTNARTRLIVRGRASRSWVDLASTRQPAGNRRIFIERAYAFLARLPRPLLIAGPCSAESEEQVLETARGVAALGVDVVRALRRRVRAEPGKARRPPAAGRPRCRGRSAPSDRSPGGWATHAGDR